MGYPYGQPGYSPPQSLPGTLQIPESGGTYAPGGGYDSDPEDDFEQSGPNKEFFGSEKDRVPFPEEPREPFYREDDLGTSLDPPDNSVAAARPVATVSHSETPVEYGYDTADYRWLRGVLEYDNKTGWSIRYSVAAADQFGGRLPIYAADESQLRGLIPGSAVDVQGRVERPANADSPVYFVEQLQQTSVPSAVRQLGK